MHDDIELGTRTLSDRTPNGHPRLSRREFVGAAALATLGCASGRMGATRAAPPPAGWELYVGTYTNDTESHGIYRLVVDATSGASRRMAIAAETANPSYLALAPGRRTLVAVNEVTTFEGRPTGTVSTFARDPATGSLSPRGRRASRGGAPCYVTVDRAARHALVANYVGGNVAVLPIGADGSIGDASAVVQHTGRGAHPVRQAAPHAHCVVLAPSGGHVVVTDLGIDRIMVHRFDAATGTLSPSPMAEVALRPGAGPRHLAFSADGRTLYVACELDSTLVALDYDSDSGRLQERQRLSTRPAGATGENFPADVHVHPSGRTVYVSNRGDDSVAVFAVAPLSGELSLTQSVATGGRWPRNFAIAPDGKLLLVANQRSGTIVAFRVDQATGALAPTGGRIALPAPVCLLFTDGVARDRP